MCNTVSFMEHFYHHYCQSENKISTVHQEKKFQAELSISIKWKL